MDDTRADAKAYTTYLRNFISFYRFEDERMSLKTN